MYYGDDILILETGVRIRPEALHPIGITNNSQCWGVQIASAPEKGKLPHLLVSAFSPQNWHILFRIEIELQNDIGAMHKVAQILERNDFDILAMQCAPSGHKHASLHIIGVALDKEVEATKALEDSIDIFNPTLTAYDDANNSFREKLTEIFSVPLMKYSKKLEELITNEDDNEPDKKKKFLHTRFRDNNTLLYKDLDQFFNDNEAELFVRIKEHELYHPVESRWLQQMAVFRSYSQASQKDGAKRHYASWDYPILFRYDANQCLLQPLGTENERKYLKVLNACRLNTDELPVRAIAAFNHEEHYVRIVLPEENERRNRVAIYLNYNIHFSGGAKSSSKGLLKEIAGILKDGDINLNYISNNTTLRTTETEEGSFSIIGTPTKDSEKPFLENLEYKLKNVDLREKISFSKTSVNKVGAKKIFISTNFAWALDPKKDIQPFLNNLVRKHGFEPIWGGGPINKKSIFLNEDVVKKIIDSDVFLQIIPEKAENQTWILFELGVARGAGLPYEICADKSNFKSSPPEVAEGHFKHTFTSSDDGKYICLDIEPAIQSLAKIIYG